VAKLYFRYSAMNASKSASLLMVAHNYEERDQKVLVLKPMIDDRSGGYIESRIGLKREADLLIEPHTDIFEWVYTLAGGKAACLLIDEAQFLSKFQVKCLCRIVDELNIPVIAYGLRTDFQGNLFDGSMWLLAWADTIEEIKTICECGKKATMNIRLLDGKRVREGDQIQIGGNESYQAVCRKDFQLTPRSKKFFE